MASEHAEKWAKAMKEEMQLLIKHETWDLIPKNDIIPGHRPLKGKWVYRIKQGVDNQILRFKARWVVKGYLQQAGVDWIKPLQLLSNLWHFVFSLLLQHSTIWI